MTAELAELTRRLRAGGQALDRAVGEAHAVAAAGKALQVEIADLRDAVATHDKVAVLLGGIADTRATAVQHQIEGLVTQGLQTIFDDSLTFALVPTTRNKTPVIDLVVRSRLDDELVETDDVLEGRGGGLAATVGFLLRLVMLLLSHRSGETVLFLDETFAHVSVDYEPRLAEFLRVLVDRTGVQVILVTHSDAYAEHADARYRFQLVRGVTQVRAL